MAVSQQAGTLGNLFPSGTGTFVRRRLAEILGVSLFLLSALIIAAVLSFEAEDPSLNTASGGTVANLLGTQGAVIADLSLQILGLIVLLPCFAGLAWGWRLMRQRRMDTWGRQVLYLLVAVTGCSLALAPLAPPEGWPFATGLGGVAGSLLASGIGTVGSALNMTVPLAWVSSLSAMVGFGAFVGALGFSRRDWRDAGHGLVKLGQSSARGTRAAAQGAAGWAARTAGHLRGPGVGLDPQAGPSLSGPGSEEDHTADGHPKGPARLGAKGRKNLVEKPPVKPKKGRSGTSLNQRSLNLETADGYQLPPLELLEGPDEITGPRHDPAKLEQNATFLASVLEDFGVKGEIVKVRPGPVVTLYELEPAPGTKTSRVVGLADDIARSMSAISVRVAVVPGRSVIGIELPNTDREGVALKELLASRSFDKTKAQLPLALGKDIGGQPVTVDLATMPHLLIAGTTGSGKSVGMNAMVLSLLYRLPPEACRLIMIDPKMLELSVYEGIPHLLTPVVTDPKKAVVALKWTVREMEDRYRAMSQLGVRNIAGYNARVVEAKRKGETLSRRVQTGFDAEGKPVFEEQALGTEPMPFIVVVVDEMADLMLVAGKDVEAAIQRLAQMARAAGIHLIMATQRPSVDVITGTIKANFPTRVSFQVTSKIDSRTILGEQGAQQLLGRGDMLYMAGGGRITRVHGPFVSDEEVEQVVAHLKEQATPEYIEDVTRDEEADAAAPGTGGGEGDALYQDAVALVAREGKASTSFVQRHLQIGYNRAARIIEQMETEGLVSPADRVGRREVLIGK